jgi:DNA polymerase
MTKQERLDQIKADITTRNICPDLASTATNLVFGDGNPDADIVFIGEAPGKQEDEQGLPFVGASGKFLSEMLEHIHMRREEVYITNIVKYRPPNNRDPEPAEKEVFLPFLLQQLAVIDPKLVVTLGRHSMTCFIPNAKISEIHGQPKRVGVTGGGFGNGDGKIVILPLYHPAAALYNGGMRATLQEDFSAIPQILTTIRKGN